MAIECNDAHAAGSASSPLSSNRFGARRRPSEVAPTSSIHPTAVARGPGVSECGRDVDAVMEDIDRDRFMAPEEAVEYGLVDAIMPPRRALPGK